MVKFYGKEVKAKDHPSLKRPKETSSSGLHTRFENIISFWTKKEYQLQELIIQGFVVHREIPGQTKRTIPFARIDIWYDGPNGIGRKGINGVEHYVYYEAKKFLSIGEQELLDDKWKLAKYEGKYNWNDPFCRQPIYDASLPHWIIGKQFKDPYTKKLIKRVKEKADKAVKESKASLDKRINDFVKNLNYKEPDEKVKASPLQDLFLTKDIDPKDVAEEGALSTLYKHIKGERELSKGKAIEYGKALGVAPATLMFDPKGINVWSNIKFSGSVIDNKTKDKIVGAGECYQRGKYEIVSCPSDIYRLDIKAVKVNDAKSIYDGFIAYYYETNKISDQANNRLCMIRVNEGGETLLSASYRYYIGIYQLFGTEKRILNPDPTSEIKVLAENVEPDLVAPIVSFTDAGAILADKVLSTSIIQVQQLGKLIRQEREERKRIFDPAILGEKYFKENAEKMQEKLIEQNKKFEEATAKVKEQISKLEAKIEAQNKERLKSRLFGLGKGLLSDSDDDIIIPDFLKEDKKRA